MIILARISKSNSSADKENYIHPGCFAAPGNAKNDVTVQLDGLAKVFWFERCEVDMI